MKRELTAARLREMVHYDAATGVFTHLRQRKGRAHGAVMGRINEDGYLVAHIGGRHQRLHRLAWLYMTGEWPAVEVDHKNGIRSDNRFENLRDTTLVVNAQNRHAPRADSASGLLGVSIDRSKRKRWRAQIMAEGVVHRLGRFETAELAQEAYMRAKRVLHAEALA